MLRKQILTNIYTKRKSEEIVKEQLKNLINVPYNNVGALS